MIVYRIFRFHKSRRAQSNRLNGIAPYGMESSLILAIDVKIESSNEIELNRVQSLGIKPSEIERNLMESNWIECNRMDEIDEELGKPNYTQTNKIKIKRLFIIRALQENCVCTSAAS